MKIRPACLICTLKSTFEGGTWDFFRLLSWEKSWYSEPDFFQGGHKSFFLIYVISPVFFQGEDSNKLEFAETEIFLGFEKILISQIRNQDALTKALSFYKHSRPFNLHLWFWFRKVGQFATLEKSQDLGTIFFQFCTHYFFQVCINIWQMFNLGTDNLAVKPYIPHKSLLQWICCKCLVW